MKDQMFGYFFFAIRVKSCAIFSLLCSTNKNKISSSGLFWLPTLLLAITLYNCSHFPYFANVLQIWTTVAGYKELAVRFVPIEKGRIF